MNQGVYSGYEEWKGWYELFIYTPDQSAYFAGETRDLAIQHADVLEIGFGRGDFLQWAIDMHARVAAVEVNSVLLKAASDRGVELIDADFERTVGSYAQRFDSIIAFDVFEHLSIDEIIIRLRAAEGMLKSGGHLLLRFPNAQSPFGLACQHGDPTHSSYLSRSVFERLIAGTQLEIVRYGPSFRAKGITLRALLARSLRYILRDAISAILNLIYATNIPYDAVVTIVLKKQSSVAD